MLYSYILFYDACIRARNDNDDGNNTFLGTKNGFCFVDDAGDNGVLLRFMEEGKKYCGSSSSLSSEP